MDTLELVLLLLVAIFISSILDQILPSISLPLVQIGLGVLIVVFWQEIPQAQVDSEQFMLLFIAPLLYDETRHVDKMEIWKNKRSVISLAIGLVIVSMVAVGFFLHAVEATIPLAAAFALGAALGPTDASAVSALSKEMQVGERQGALLSGEAMINDATGVVCFQFAVAAALTGTFSAAKATTTFLGMFLGGIIIGALFGAVMRWLEITVERKGWSNTTAHVVMDVLIPFLAFLLGEELGASGVLAVVAAGLTFNTGRKNDTVAYARINITTNNVWDMLVFVINGIIFVFLGMQLPSVFAPSWENATTNPWLLLLIAFGIALVTMVIRFLWLLVLEYLTMHKSGISGGFKAVAKDTLVVTLGGCKGAVTLSVICTLPSVLSDGSAFPERSMLIFLASAVILITFVCANFALPKLAPKPDKRAEKLRMRDAHVGILLDVVDFLEKHETPDNKAATQEVVVQFNDRIRHIRDTQTGESSERMLVDEILHLQIQVVHVDQTMGKVSRESSQRFANKLKKIKKMNSRGIDVTEHMKAPWRDRKMLFLPKPVQRILERFGIGSVSIKDKAAVRTMMLDIEKATVKFLTEALDDEDKDRARCASMLLIDHEKELKIYEEKFATQDTGKLFGPLTGPIMGKTLEDAFEEDEAEDDPTLREIRAEAYRLELEGIQADLNKGKITREMARNLREGVYLLQMDQSDVF